MTEGLQILRSEFALWRSGKTHGNAKIPDRLIERARAFCDELSVNEVSLALGVPARKLKNVKIKSAPKPNPSFVEVKVPAAPTPRPVSNEVRIEIKDRGRTTTLILPPELLDLKSLLAGLIR